MAYDEKVAAYALEQLSAFGKITTKKMFGSLSFMKDGIIFGAILGDALRLKGDEETAKDYEIYGMGKWQVPGRKMKMPYYQVPEEIMKDKMKLKKWADIAYGVALKSKAKKAKKKKK